TLQARPGRSRAPKIGALVAALATGLAACGDDPFAFNWSDRPDTVVLYSMARPEMTVPSGFNFYAKQKVPVEAPNATGNWDVALDTREGDLVFLPPGALCIQSRARVAPLQGIP